MIASIRHMARLVQISRVLARHNALFFLESLKIAPVLTMVARAFSARNVKGTPGERLAKAFQELGPTFIKLGQALAVRPDLVGDEVAEGLAELQDRVPPFPTPEARAVIERELGGEVKNLFPEFEECPVAAASIAQVHFAKDAKGREVAIKILRPGVEQQFKQDIALFYWIAETVDRRLPKLRRLKPVEVVRTFEQTVAFEMDLRFEAAAASELQENIQQDPGVRIPQIYWELTAQSVLVMERVHGIRIDKVKALKKAGHDVEAIMRHASGNFFQQVYRDGFFHADLHPGNLFVDDKGTIVMVDFGIMGRIDKQTRLFLAQMLLAFLNRDYQKVAQIHFDAGYIPADQSVDRFAQACRSIAEPVFGLPQEEISIARLLAQLFKVTEDFQMETQPQLLLLQKTMMLAEGLGRKLNPKVNFWEEARPLVEQWARKHLGVQGRAVLLAEAVQEQTCRVQRVLGALDHLPQLITPQGIRLHPDTTRRRHGIPARYWMGVVLISAVVSAIAVWLLA